MFAGEPQMLGGQEAGDSNGSFLSNLVGDGVPVIIKVDPKSVALTATGILVAVVLGIVLGNRLK